MKSGWRKTGRQGQDRESGIHFCFKGMWKGLCRGWGPTPVIPVLGRSGESAQVQGQPGPYTEILSQSKL